MYYGCSINTTNGDNNGNIYGRFVNDRTLWHAWCTYGVYVKLIYNNNINNNGNNNNTVIITIIMIKIIINGEW